MGAEVIAALKVWQFADTDVVNPDDYDSSVKHDGSGRGAGRNVPWLIHDHGFALAVVFASCEQDALDAAVDADKLDKFQIDPTDAGDLADYFTTVNEQNAELPDYVDGNEVKWYYKDGMSPCHLGNAGEPFDLETIAIVQLPNPPFSFAALFNAAKDEGRDGFK